jgi:spore coat protein U-like protein
MKSALSVLALGFLASGLAPLPAVAATASSSFGVTATVQAACVVSASAMTFGLYAGSAMNATSTVSVNCTNSTPYNVGLGAGLAPGATVASRKMTGPGSALLSYALASNSPGIVNWGQTVGTDTVAGTGNGFPQTLSIHGQIPPGQYVAAGAYADTITVTVTY